MDMNQYLQIFIEESEENVQRLNQNLLELENTPENKEIINEIFRGAHTLKGMAGSMGFVNMQNLTHKMENVLDEIRNDNIEVTSHILDVLFKGLDALEKYVEHIKLTATEGDEDNQKLIVELSRILNPEERTQDQMPTDEVKTSLPDEVKSMIELASTSGMNPLKVKINLSSSCMLKAARMFILFRELEGKGEVIYSEPSVEQIENEDFGNEVELILLTNLESSEIEETIGSVGEIDSVNAQQLQLEKNEKAISAGEVEQQIKKEDTKSKRISNQTVKSSKSVRVNIDRLDTLMNLVSELIIVKTQLQEGVTKEMGAVYNESVEYLERITTNLHESVMKVRMVPVESVFNRFPRMIRDVAVKLEKEIELVISGKETELDRVVIDEIGDPLVHLLRNAADHGLESPEDRIKAGKDKKGTIYLRAYQQGSNVVIEVEDDGAGIDVTRLREKFAEKGRITEEEALTMEDKEVIELLFKPNFSTAEKVTDLSGRGVGLDVVKSKITSLGGEVTIDTQAGKGSRFVVKLPLTLAIVEALLVRIGNEKYAIPLEYVQNIEEIEEESFKEVKGKKVIMRDHNVIPVKDIRSLLEIPQEDEKSNLHIIIQRGSKQVAISVDDLVGQQEVVIKSLGAYLSRNIVATGATILGNGEVALILDANNLIHYKGE